MIKHYDWRDRNPNLQNALCCVHEDPGNWSTDISSSEDPTTPPTRELPSPGDYHLVGNTRQTFIGWAEEQG
jgi:hypothetical protein